MIDGDALIAKQASIAKTFARSDAQKSLIGRVIYNTEKAPTIDAIPVEWLKKVQTECVCDVQQIPMYVAIGWLRDMWQKEQEAR